MLKAGLVKVFYPIIELLPARCAEKIKMIGCILCGNWHMALPDHTSFTADKFAAVTESELKDLYKDLDETSQNNILAYWRYVTQEPQNNLPDGAVFFNYDKLYSAKEQAQSKTFISQAHKSMRRECRRFKLPWSLSARSDYSVWYYHHGLKFAPEAVKNYVKDTLFVDAGAFTGESSLLFLQYYQPQKVYAFEPSPLNAARCQKNLRRNFKNTDSYEVIAKGLSDHDCRLSLSADGTASANLTAAPANDNTIEIVALDQYLAQVSGRFGMIKADVEGMALPLLKGAIAIIKRDLPVLSICIYHNGEELTGVYKYLREQNLPYDCKVEFQSFAGAKQELTLLAWPRQINQ